MKHYKIDPLLFEADGLGLVSGQQLSLQRFMLQDV
jgi:hypothetical protein